MVLVELLGDSVWVDARQGRVGAPGPVLGTCRQWWSGSAGDLAFLPRPSPSFRAWSFPPLMLAGAHRLLTVWASRPWQAGPEVMDLAIYHKERYIHYG